MIAPKVATLISRIFFLCGMGIALWLLAGFYKFADEVVKFKTPNNVEIADGIATLTGGSKLRLSEGIRLLELKKGQRLLISGVDRKVTLEDMRLLAGGSRELYSCCVDLGREAVDTIGNAEEVRDWVKRNNFKKIILITDNFHMPRARLEITAANPNLEIIIYPVRAGNYLNRNWWEDGLEFSGLLNEYGKYVAAQLRLKIGFTPYRNPRP